MDDLISREDALERLRSIPTDLGRRELDDAIKAVENTPSKGKAASTITIELKPEQIKKYVEQAITGMIPSARQWIPCSERLPEEDGTYFVSGVWENGDVEVGQLEYIADEHRFSNVIYFNVDAWMPLPEPYREEAES